MALQFAGIEYDSIWDAEVIGGGLKDYEWLHLHHEDFTGQYSKFFLTYSGSPWLTSMVQLHSEMARRLGFGNVPDLKKAVARGIRDYVTNGGFLFGMCAATETLELALAGQDVDIAANYADGTPMDPAAAEKMQWDRSLAFHGARLDTSPSTASFSDIDGHQVNNPPLRQPLGAFKLFSFSAKIDPVPAMLVQSHRQVVPDFYGLTTSFNRNRLKPGVIELASEGRSPWVKYIQRGLGEGNMDLPRRSRSGRPPTPSWRSANGPVPAPDVPRLSSHPQQLFSFQPRRNANSRPDAHDIRRESPLGRRDRGRWRTGGVLRRTARPTGSRGRCPGGRPGNPRLRARPPRECRAGRDGDPQSSERGARTLRRRSRHRREAARCGLGLGIIDNAAASLYVVVEVPRAPEYTPLDPVGTAAMLGASGAVAKTLTQFEDRPSQQDMASYVADLYNEGGVALLEAGTGIGKSFAYLVAAALWARENGERTVVSTNTINLQEQLIGKDLPLLRRALSGDGEELTYALLKGWRNYVCLSRLELARGGAGSLLAPGSTRR